MPLESSANRRLTIHRYREGVLFINMLVKMKNMKSARAGYSSKLSYFLNT